MVDYEINPPRVSTVLLFWGCGLDFRHNNALTTWSGTRAGSLSRNEIAILHLSISNGTSKKRIVLGRRRGLNSRLRQRGGPNEKAPGSMVGSDPTWSCTEFGLKGWEKFYLKKFVHSRRRSNRVRRKADLSGLSRAEAAYIALVQAVKNLFGSNILWRR